MKYVLVTGGFDPLHSGHIEYFRAAARLGDKLIVGLNSDDWLERKKGKAFMPFEERATIIENLEVVDEVIDFDDSYDHNGASSAIFKLRATVVGDKDELIVANGGDRVDGNVPEQVSWGDTPGIKFVFGVGGTNKKNSSSWILDEWKSPREDRGWGWYRVLDQKKGYKVKELVIQPTKSLSMQRHQQRNEHWYILSGSCIIDNTVEKKKINSFESHVIEKNTWHKGTNRSTTTPCHILEVQYGSICEEWDIERDDDYDSSSSVSNFNS